MIHPHPGGLYTIRGGDLATRLCTSLTLTVLHRHSVVASTSLHAFILCDLTLKATYAEPMPPVEVEGLEPQGDNDCP